MSRRADMKHFVKYLLSFAIGFLIAMIVAFYEIAHLPENQQYIARAWCDGTFVSGIFILCFSLLVIIAGSGAFDGMTYAARRLADAFRHPKNVDRKKLSYFDYLQQKNRKRYNYFSLLITGISYIAVSCLLLIFL